MKSKHFSVRSKALPILRSDHARGTQSEKRKLPAYPRGSPLSAGRETDLGGTVFAGKNLLPKADRRGYHRPGLSFLKVIN